MITWITLFLGLVAGPRTAEVAADESVARVELLLDGTAAGAVEAAPWALEVDLGEALLPHELTAVAYDGEGRERSRIRQMVNLPRPPVELRIALEEGREGRYRSARLVWEAAADENLVEARFFFDGEPLPAADPRRVGLPEYDPRRMHYLTAEASFEDDLASRAAVAFGGRFVGQVDSELTAVAVRWRGQGEVPEPPSRERMEGWFRYRGRPVPVFTVDRPPADIVVVRDRQSSRRLARLAGRVGRPVPVSRQLGSHLGRDEEVLAARLGGGLAPGDRLRFVATVPEWTADRSAAVFEYSADFGARAPGLGWALVRLRFEQEGVERLADAVAAAGVAVAAGGRPRAVVLVASPSRFDESQHSPAAVRRYLEALRVPFAVWAPVDAELVAARWPQARAVDSRRKLRAAVEDLRRRLDRQLVVWLEGRLLPQEIELTPEARGRVELAR